MRLLYKIFLVIIVAKIGSTEDLKDFSVPQLVRLAQDVTRLNSEKVEETDVSFYLTTTSIKNPTKLDNSNLDLLNTTILTKYVIHGWLEDRENSWYQNIANEFFKIMDVNFIEVDWKRPARFNYFMSAVNTKNNILFSTPVLEKAYSDITSDARMMGILTSDDGILQTHQGLGHNAMTVAGDLIAKFIIDSDLDPKTIHLIGHSLGSHVAGFCAKEVYRRSGKKIRRISALDPAGPYFKTYFANSSKRLDKHDADIVDAIHTDGGVNGYEFPIGTVDFYVNRGKRVQPGCLEHNDVAKTVGGAIQSTFCSHTRSYAYFVEWINNGKFRCRFCTPLTTWLGENCLLQNNVVLLGEEDIDEHVTGICFAITNLHPPFLSNPN